MTTQAASSLDARDLETLTEGGLAALAGLKVSISQEDFGGTFRGSIEEWKGRPGPDTYGLGFFIEGDRPIGMVLLKRPPESPTWVSHQAISLHGLKIAEAFQGRGLGRAALGLAIERAQSRWSDAKSMILAVDAENTAGNRALSQFRHVGQWPGFQRAGWIRAPVGIGFADATARQYDRIEVLLMKMFQVDAFTDRLFAGNPAAVLVLEDWLDDELMLAVAEENNLAETAFVKQRTNGDWDLRWFTPAHEVDFCGHATLATAHVLASEYGGERAMTFHTRVGPLNVERHQSGYRLDIPALPPEKLSALPQELDGVFATAPMNIFRNFENIFADLGSEHAVRCFEPDLMKIAKLGLVGLVITGKGDGSSGAAFVSRYFAPGAGIPEDPVTGSTHATLVPYWSDVLGAERHRAFQASKRGGWLDCEHSGDRVILIGNAVTFMEASIQLPCTMTVEP